MPEQSTAVAQSSEIHPSRWFSRPKLIALFWVGTVIGLMAMAYTGHIGWDAQYSWNAIQELRRGADPYAESIIAVERAMQRRENSGAEKEPPLVYQYPPLTLPLLRLLAVFPAWMLSLGYGAAVAAGASLQLWAGFQMAEKYERRWLALMLPAVAFFPGLITDDVILSGNIAYVLYGVIFAAAVPGWKRGNWSWYYIAVLAASICKLPFLSLLAFPVLIGRRQWFPSGVTAAAGVLVFAAQMGLWPEMFHEYLLTLRLMFDWGHDYGFGPVGVLGEALMSRGLSPSPATTIVYLVFVGVLGVAFLFLARRVRDWNLPLETWVPVALVGTLLLNPRIKKYDLAAFSIPMLLIAWRTLRSALERSALKTPAGGPVLNRFLRMPILVAAGCFLAPNVITVVGPSWFPGELLVLLAILAMGVWLVNRSCLEAVNQYAGSQKILSAP